MSALTPSVAAEVLSCAIEGGTNYWAAVSDITRDADLGVTRVLYHPLTEAEDGYEEKGRVVSAESVKRAIRLIAYSGTTCGLSKGSCIINDCRALLFEDDADYDADTADAVVQVALFGKLVYG